MMSANHELLIQIQYILLYGAWAIVGFYGILRFLRFFCEEDNKYFSKLVYLENKIKKLIPIYAFLSLGYALIALEVIKNG